MGGLLFASDWFYRFQSGTRCRRRGGVHLIALGRKRTLALDLPRRP